MKIIIVPTDFTDIAERAYPIAASIASKTDSKIVFHHNVPTLLLWDIMTDEEKQQHSDIQTETREAAAELDAIIARSEFKNTPCDKRITYGITYEQIMTTAKRMDATLIVMGSHRNIPGGRSFIDSTIQKVLHGTNCPVLTINDLQETTSWNKMLVPLSFNEDVHHAFHDIHDFALRMQSVVHLLYINRPDRFKETSFVEKQMKDFTSHYPDLKFELGLLDSLDVEAGIMEYVARTKPDYIAMVTHDHKRHPKYLLSTTETIAYHASIPLITVPILRYIPQEEVSAE